MKKQRPATAITRKKNQGLRKCRHKNRSPRKLRRLPQFRFLIQNPRHLASKQNSTASMPGKIPRFLAQILPPSVASPLVERCPKIQLLLLCELLIQQVLEVLFPLGQKASTTTTNSHRLCVAIYKCYLLLCRKIHTSPIGTDTANGPNIHK